jgi:microcystin-dependent protein
MDRDAYNETIISATAGGAPTVLMAGVLVTVYLAGTTTKATLYSGRTGTTQIANPFEAVNGIARFWVDPGPYDVAYSDSQVPKRIADQTISWNALGASPGANPASIIADGTLNLAKLDASIVNFLIPVGSVFPYAGPTEPVGFKFANGQSLVKASFTALYNRLKGAGAYPFGEDATNFSLPNLGGKIPLGVGGGHAMATAGGEELHSISVAEMPSHNHGGATGGGTTGTDSPDHTHAPPAGSTIYLIAGGGVTNVSVPSVTGGTLKNFGATGGATARHAHAVPALGIGAQGGSGGHNNMQPYLTLNYIIRDGT